MKWWSKSSNVQYMLLSVVGANYYYSFGPLWKKLFLIIFFNFLIFFRMFGYYFLICCLFLFLLIFLNFYFLINFHLFIYFFCFFNFQLWLQWSTINIKLPWSKLKTILYRLIIQSQFNFFPLLGCFVQNSQTIR